MRASALPAAWPPAVEDYRALLRAFSKDVSAFAAAGRALREGMAASDPDYPLYPLAPPEGWANDPNGVTFDPASGLYHRFFQYDKTYSEDCAHGRWVNCSAFGFGGLNRNSRVWGHTVSRDLATWEDWPGIDADSPSDRMAVYSGNCVLRPGRRDAAADVRLGQRRDLRRGGRGWRRGERGGGGVGVGGVGGVGRPVRQHRRFARLSHIHTRARMSINIRPASPTRNRRRALLGGEQSLSRQTPVICPADTYTPSAAW